MNIFIVKFKILFVLLFISLLYSCGTPEPLLTILPPSYSFVEDTDPNTVSEEYLARIENYDRILRSSPIPVYVLSIEDFTNQIFLEVGSNFTLGKISDINILGMYLYGSPVENLPPEFIFINKALIPEQIMATYFHEIGHHYHMKEGCKGCLESHTIRESHAIHNELKMGWEQELPYVLRSTVITMKIYITRKDADLVYKLASFEVMKTDLFKQTVEYLTLIKKRL